MLDFGTGILQNLRGPPVALADSALPIGSPPLWGCPDFNDSFVKHLRFWCLRCVCFLCGFFLTGLGMCELCTEAVHCVALWTRVTLQAWACVKYMYRSSPLRSTLNTGYISGLGMCEVCTEAVDCVALWTRVTLQVWACVHRNCRLRSILKTTSFKKQKTRKHHDGFGPAGKNMFF